MLAATRPPTSDLRVIEIVIAMSESSPKDSRSLFITLENNEGNYCYLEYWVSLKMPLQCCTIEAENGDGDKQPIPPDLMRFYELLASNTTIAGLVNSHPPQRLEQNIVASGDRQLQEDRNITDLINKLLIEYKLAGLECVTVADFDSFVLIQICVNSGLNRLIIEIEKRRGRSCTCTLHSSLWNDGATNAWLEQYKGTLCLQLFDGSGGLEQQVNQLICLPISQPEHTPPTDGIVPRSIHPNHPFSEYLESKVSDANSLSGPSPPSTMPV